MREEVRLFHYPPHQRDAVTRALRRALEAQSDVLFAYLHGSFATDGPFQDIDVAVYLDDVGLHHPGLRVMTLTSNIQTSLARDMETDVPAVDVRALNEAPLGFCYQALRGGRLLISRDEPLRIEWVARTVGRYLDLKPLRTQTLKEAMTACR